LTAERSDGVDAGRPCAFFDRDGVINVDMGYTHKPEELVFMPGAPEAVRMLNEAGYYVVVVTNQSGVALGRYDEDQVHAFHAALNRRLAEVGARVDAFYYCPFHKDAVVERYRAADHEDRKPNPGMILKALEDLPIRREGSFLIGDRESDLAAAAAAGLPGYRYEGGDLRDVVRASLGLREPKRRSS
jgi:D-glycero-D-manno-heptose 1,7-bisphosphate phosphatase